MYVGLYRLNVKTYSLLCTPDLSRCVCVCGWGVDI